MAQVSVMQKKKKKKEKKGPDMDAWMVTFSDLLQLLITFFVLLISMSSMDTKIFKEMFAVFTGGIGVLNFTDQSPMIPPSFSTNVIPPKLDVEDFKALIKGEAKHLDERAASAQEVDNAIESIMISGVDIEKKGRNFAMVMEEEAMFEKGGAQLTPHLMKTLDQVNFVLSLSRNKIIIEGHTDDFQFSSSVLPTNWELTAARAMAVYIYLANKGDIDPERMEAKGLAGHHPLVKNISERYRKRNRRIEIVVKQFAKDVF